MSRLLPIFFLLIFCQNIVAQIDHVDSVLLKLATMPEDTNKVLTYQTLADNYLIKQLDSSIIYGQKALELSRTLKHDKGIIHSLNVIGNYYERKTEYKKALSTYNEALEISRKNNYIKGFAIILNNIAIVHTRTGEYEKALTLYFEALEAEEKLNNQKGIAQAYNNIGVIYYYQQNIDKTLEYFEKSIVIEERLGHADILKKGYNNIGALFNYQKKYKKALEYYQKSYTLSKMLDDKTEISINLNNIAIAHHALNNLDSATIYHNQSLALRKTLGDYRGAAYSYHNFATVSTDRGDIEQAEKFFLKSLVLAKEKKVKEVESETYKGLATLWEGQKDFEKANKYLRLHLEAKDSMVNELNARTLLEIETKYETAKNEKEILEQQSQIDKQQIEINQKNIQLLSLGSTAAILLLIGFLIFNYLRQRNKQLKKEHQLKDAMSKIETQEKLQKQRYQISRDLHDNIGAQLTFIISSIDNLKYGFQLESPLIHRLKKITDFTSSTIRDLRDTIWAMNKDAIDFSDLKQRIHNFTCSAQDSSENIEFDFTIGSELHRNYSLSSIQGMNIYRITQEAVNNALKYSEAKKIKISIHKNNNTLLFKTSDNGKGFDINTAKLSHGLHNMQKRAAEIGAELNINSIINQGTFVTLSLVVD